VVSEGTKQFWQTFNQGSDLPWFDNPPALEFVHTVKTHEYQDDGAAVIDDANDHPDLAPHCPKLFGFEELWIPGVELMCFSAIHH